MWETLEMLTLMVETYMTLVICLVILLTCSLLLYWSPSKKPPSLKELQSQLSMDGIKRAEQKVVNDLVDAVEEVKEFVIPRRPQRFRKRDRVWFYGRRFIRRVEDNVKYMENVGVNGKMKGQKMISNLTKKMFLNEMSDQSSTGDMNDSRPAEDWLEEESETPRTWVPPELRYLLNSFHMFGQFDPAVFSEVYPSIETMRVPAGQFLFRIGEPDMFIFVVQSGRLEVTSTDSKGTLPIKKVGAGESLTSLLSFIDILTGHARPYKTVQAQARVDSVVLRLSMESFLPVFDKSPELLIRVVQMIMARVQRVVFIGLHQYLGLSSELMDVDQVHHPMDDNDLSIEMELALAKDLGDYGSRAEEEGVKGLQKELGLVDDTLLKSLVEVRSLSEGDTIMSEHSHSDVALGFIVHGELVMYQKDGKKEDELYTARVGTCFGQVAMLTGEASFYTCKARRPTVVALLSKTSFFSIVSSTPEMVLSLAHSTIRTLSPLVRKIDFALDWLTVESGRQVNANFQGCTFIVLSGRLRGYTLNIKKEKKLCGEYGRGTMVGLVDVITGVRQRKSYLAVRDTELCVIPGQLLEFLKTRNTVVMSKLINILGNRLVLGEGGGGVEGDGDKDPVVRYNTVAVMGNTEQVPVLAFCLELEQAMSLSGPVSHLSSSIVRSKLGPAALDVSQDYRLNSWLGQQEDRNTCVIYQCDLSPTSDWSKKCLRHADLVLVVVRADTGVTEVTESEHELERLGRRIRKELVILWPKDTKHPTGTREWLKKRAWLSAHVHVKMPSRMTKYRSKDKINKMYSRLVDSPPDIHSDFSRIARGLQGKSIGLVLGGGGARGAAHLGMLKAIDEAGIPIDKVGGVSIGAFMCGLWALHRDIGPVTESARSWFAWMCNMNNALFDITYPVTSIFTGRYFNSSITDTFPPHINIEDLWIPYYCVSTNINTSTERIHTRGTLWRYVRASMSYAWILPPICDPVDGHLLMDGCYVNNVPGDVMLRSSCSHIIVVDVTLSGDTELTNYGDELSGWWLLWKKWSPFASTVKIPTQGDIQERLSYCSHYKNLEALKNNSNYEYIQPPVGHFSSSKFDLFEDIFNSGYHHGSTFFYGLKKAVKNSKEGASGDAWLPTAERARRRPREREKRDSLSYTFTDLAQMVVTGVKVGKEWQHQNEREKTTVLKQDQDSDDTGIVI